MAHDLGKLSEREPEVLRLLARGYDKEPFDIMAASTQSCRDSFRPRSGAVRVLRSLTRSPAVLPMLLHHAAAIGA